MIRKRQSWRDLQHDLKRQAARKKLIKRLTRLVFFIPLLIIAFYAINFDPRDSSNPEASIDPSTQQEDPALYSKQEVRNLIRPDHLVNITRKDFNLTHNGETLHVCTSLDMNLQNYILDEFESVKKKKRGKPRYVAIVVLNPETGKIVSMAGFDSSNDKVNPCLDHEYPAASLFKIVTAAAAVEKLGYCPQSHLKFNGGKYTLYKRQLNEKTNKYTNRISFSDSFAQSVNPVFGKLGALHLGKNILERYGDAFGFNQEIDFELPLVQSALNVTDEPYQRAEIACGFNRDTLVSPLHAALLPSIVLNDGLLIEPTIIDQITDDEGQILYTGKTHKIHQAIRPETSSVLKKLMAGTVNRGTGRKSFRGYRKDAVLSQLEIGGKTGSIFNKSHDVRLDWFVGFAQEKHGPGKIAIAVLVGHEKYIGTRACKYARLVMKKYFGNQFAQKESQTYLAGNTDSAI